MRIKNFRDFFESRSNESKVKRCVVFGKMESDGYGMPCIEITDSFEYPLELEDLSRWWIRRSMVRFNRLVELADKNEVSEVEEMAEDFGISDENIDLFIKDENYRSEIKKKHVEDLKERWKNKIYQEDEVYTYIIFSSTGALEEKIQLQGVSNYYKEIKSTVGDDCYILALSNYGDLYNLDQEGKYIPVEIEKLSDENAEENINDMTEAEIITEVATHVTDPLFFKYLLGLRESAPRIYGEVIKNMEGTLDPEKMRHLSDVISGSTIFKRLGI